MKVSACIITYNQEAYLKQCLDAAVNQKIDFEYEIVIGDDNSTDGTSAICADYAQRFPKLIKYHRRSQNLGMVGNWMQTIKDCSGDFIALCEGDDYWSDTQKLQKQTQFLMQFPEYVLCFHKANVLKSDGTLVADFITNPPGKHENLLDLATAGNFIHTPTVMFRNVIEHFPPEFSATPIADFFLYMLLAEKGKIKQLTENMAVYRYGVGVHTSKTAIKRVTADFNLYSLLISYSKNYGVNEHLLARQRALLEYRDALIRAESQRKTTSNPVLSLLKRLKEKGKHFFVSKHT